MYGGADTSEWQLSEEARLLPLAASWTGSSLLTVIVSSPRMNDFVLRLLLLRNDIVAGTPLESRLECFGLVCGKLQ